MPKKLQAVETKPEEQPVQDGEEEMPPTIGIVRKVLMLQSLVATFVKDAKNSHFKYQFASATSINESVKPILAKLGLVALVRTTVEDVTPAGLVVSKTDLTLLDADGDWSGGEIDGVNSITFTSIGSGIDSGDKAAMKAATASQKYATIAAVYGATADDPEADARTDMRGTPVSAAPPRVRSNRPAPGAVAEEAGSVPVGDNGNRVVTISVDKVYDGRPTRSGKMGPGTIVSQSGHKFDTFDKGLLGIARKAHAEGKRINVMYAYNEQFKRNSIVEDGVSIFGEVDEADEARGVPGSEDEDGY